MGSALEIGYFRLSGSIGWVSFPHIDDVFRGLVGVEISAIYLKSAKLPRCCDIIFIPSLLLFTMLLLDSAHFGLFLFLIHSV